MSSKNKIRAFETQIHSHVFYSPPAKRNPVVHNINNANNSKYVYSESQIRINTTFAKQNPPYFKHLFHIQKVLYSAGPETQLYKLDFPVINRYSKQFFKSQPPTKKQCFLPNLTVKISRLNLFQFHISTLIKKLNKLTLTQQTKPKCLLRSELLEFDSMTPPAQRIHPLHLLHQHKQRHSLTSAHHSLPVSKYLPSTIL